MAESLGKAVDVDCFCRAHVPPAMDSGQPKPVHFRRSGETRLRPWGSGVKVTEIGTAASEFIGLVTKVAAESDPAGADVSRANNNRTPR